MGRRRFEMFQYRAGPGAAAPGRFRPRHCPRAADGPAQGGALRALAARARVARCRHRHCPRTARSRRRSAKRGGRAAPSPPSSRIRALVGSLGRTGCGRCRDPRRAVARARLHRQLLGGAPDARGDRGEPPARGHRAAAVRSRGGGAGRFRRRPDACSIPRAASCGAPGAS